LVFYKRKNCFHQSHMSMICMWTNWNIFLPSNIRFHTILMHDGVYYEPHYSVMNCKSQYMYTTTYTINIVVKSTLIFRSIRENYLFCFVFVAFHVTTHISNFSTDELSGSALFIKTKNHVRACPLLKHPCIHFIFAKIKQYTYKSHCFKIHLHTYTRVQKQIQNCI
jgi:hypothetical protein